MREDWLPLLEYSFQTVWVQVTNLLPEILVAFVLVVVGWLVGGAAKKIIERVFASLGVNNLLDSAGMDTLTKRAGYKLNAGAFVGGLVKWFVIIVFFIAALDVLNLEQVMVFFRDVVLGYLPQVIVAVLILFGAMIVANVVDKSVVAGTRAAGFTSPEILGTFARYAIIVFATLAALNQLEIAPELVQMLFAGFVFATALALGLAFGLGGRETAARYLESLSRKIDRRS
jgi:hypothetical protein